MGLVGSVRQSLRDVREQHPSDELDDALAEAERLADLYSEVKPQPYIVPIERFAGLPIFNDRSMDEQA